MKVRFSVVLFAPPNARVAITGSIPDLGSWNSPVPLSPMQIPDDQYHPSMWTTVIDISDTTFKSQSDFEYKFIRWISTPLTSIQQPVHLENELVFPEPVHICAENKVPPNAVWEGHSESDNRKFIFNGDPNLTTHVYNLAINMTPDIIYSMPVALFRDPLSAVSEASHTTRYYRRLKEKGEMHFSQILMRVYVGTCPRNKKHIEKLKNEAKISDVINFQTLEDIIENYPDPEGTPLQGERSISKVYDIFDSFNIRYIWIPTTDMCSASRARTIAQASFLLAGLLQRSDCTGIYIHCNAGVGRSIACISGFMHCCLGVPVRLTNLIISARRPVAYFDEPALIQGAKDFEIKFLPAIKAFNLMRLNPSGKPSTKEKEDLLNYF